jgi:hypothetical protein
MPVDVTTVNLLMTDSAIAKTRRSQIMKCRRYNPDDACCARCLLRQVGVTLETQEADLRPRQHFRIGRPMRFMAGLTSFCSQWRVLIGEGTTKIRMTLKASGFVRRKCANLLQQKTAMRVMTI